MYFVPSIVNLLAILSNFTEKIFFIDEKNYTSLIIDCHIISLRFTNSPQ